VTWLEEVIHRWEAFIAMPEGFILPVTAWAVPADGRSEPSFDARRGAPPP
jgi:hypothetical protein